MTTDWDSIRRIKGQTDIPLNARGEEEAEHLAQTLVDLGITLIVGSDLKRSSKTGEIINLLLKCPLRSDKRLRECSFGKLEGLTREQAVEQYGSEILLQWDDQFANYDFRPFGGESRNDVLKRHLELINYLFKTSSHDHILLVGHGRGLATLLNSWDYPPNLKRGEYRIIDFSK